MKTVEFNRRHFEYSGCFLITVFKPILLCGINVIYIQEAWFKFLYLNL